MSITSTSTDASNITDAQPSIISPTTHKLHSDVDVHSDAITDAQRALAFRKYDTRIEEIAPDRRYMPLSEDKEPAIRGMGEGALDDPERGGKLLHTPSEAVKAIKNGHIGFCLYAGKETHGTENLVHVDYDDPEQYPLETIPIETLTVRSGSGGYHKAFRNDGTVAGADGKGDYEGFGEVRAHGRMCVCPGAIHETGNVYHLCNDNEIATLSNDDLPDDLTPNGSSSARTCGSSRSTTGTYASDSTTARVNGVIDVHVHQQKPDEDIDEFRNQLGVSLDDVRKDAWKLNERLSNGYETETIDTDDKSTIDAIVINNLRYHWFSYQQIATIWQQYFWRRKLKRTDYIGRTLSHNEPIEYGDYDSDLKHGSTVRHCPLLPDPETVTVETGCETPTVADARSRRDDVFDHAINTGIPTLIDGTCNIGKTYRAIHTAIENDIPVTHFTSRNELRDDVEEIAEEADIEYKRIYSPNDRCECFTGEHGDVWQQRVLTAQNNQDLTARDMHKHAVDLWGEPMPCDDGTECPYKLQWDFEPSDYDVITCHYNHAWIDSLRDDRACIIDEFSGSDYVDTYKNHRVTDAVTAFCKQHDSLPFDSYSDVLNAQGDQFRSGITNEWFEQNDCINDVESVINADNGHILGGLFTYAIVCAENLKNGWDHVTVDEYTIARNRESGTIYVLNPPSFDGAQSVIGLDGTPAPILWDMVLGTELDHIPILDDDAANAYLNETMGITVIQCTDTAAYPNGNGKNTKPYRDAALYTAIASEHDSDVPVIAPNGAIERYDDTVLNSVSETEHYGNLKGSNQFKDASVGVVTYSTHYGDGFMQRWAALAGESDERVNDTSGMDTMFNTDIGNDALYLMREAQVTQAALRYGRTPDTNTTIYTMTAATDDLPTANENGTVLSLSVGQQEILRAICEAQYRNDSDNRTMTTPDIVDMVSVSRRTVSRFMNQLHEYDYVTKERSGNAIEWTATDRLVTMYMNLAHGPWTDQANSD